MNLDDPYQFRFDWRPDSPEPTRAELIEALQTAFWLLWDECTENNENENTRLGGKTRSNFLLEHLPKSVNEWVLHGDEPAILEAEDHYNQWLESL